MKRIDYFLKHFLIEALPISLIPATFFIFCYSLEASFDNLLNQQNSLSPVVSQVKEWSLQCYSSFWSFVITMFLLHLLIRLTPHTVSIWSKETSAKIIQKQNKSNLFGLLLSLVISYIIIFAAFTSAVFVFAQLPIDIQSPIIQATKINDPFSPSNLLPQRLLTQQKTSNFGEILSSIDRPVYSLVFSPKRNFLYVSFLDNGLGVYDVSNLNKPQSMEPVKTSPGEVLLSHDENTVFIYNGQTLEIFVYDDVYKSVVFYNLIEVNRGAAKNDYRPLRMSSAGNLLFFGGNTFQIFDVADNRDLKCLYKSEDYTENPITSIAISKDDKTVFLTSVNSSLRILDISNPRDPGELSQFKIDGVPTSIDLFHKANQLILASFQINDFELKHELFVQRIDVNDLKNPKLISTNFTSFCQDEGESYILEKWNRCANSQVKVYNEDDQQIMFYDENNLQLISFSTDNPIIFMPEYIDSPKSITFWPGSNIAFIGASRLLVVKLGLEVIPNKQLPLQANILWETFLNEINPYRTVVTSDSKIAFIAGEQEEKYRLGIYDISNYKSPKYLQSIKLSDKPVILTLSPDEKFLYVGISNSLQIVNVTNILTPKTVRTLSFNDSVVACTLSLDGKLAYIMLKDNNQRKELTPLNLAIVNLANKTNSFQQDQDFFLIKFQTTPPYMCFSLDDSLILSEDGKTLFFLDKDLSIFTLPTWQDLLDKAPIRSAKVIYLSNSRCPSIRFAPNSSELLYVLSVAKAPSFQILKVLNISSGETLTSIPLTYRGRDFFCSNSLLVLSKMNMLAVAVPDSLMFFDISKPSALTLIGDFKIEFSGGLWKSLIPLNNSSTIFFPSNTKGVTFFTLDQQYALSTLSKSLKLGEHYSEEIQVLSQNAHTTYNPFSSPYKFNTLSLCNYKTSPLLQYPEIRFSQLPSWMYFDKDNGVLVSEPRKESDIQSYRICSTISQKLSAEDFDGISQFSSSSVLSYLVSLGYIGVDYFLSKSFDPSQELVLDTRFNSSVQRSITDVLTKKYILTGFQLNVEPSLELKLDSWPIQIKTPSRNPVNVIIQLDSSTGNTKFANKAYPNVLESITNNKTQITLDGSLLYINYALEQLLVHLEEESFDACQGSITVTDRLNPTINKTISTKFFKKYSPPLLNPNLSFSLRNQIANVRVYAGQYNLIPLDHQAFKPQHEEELTYQLIMQDGSQVPEWISLRDLNLIVSSPEKSFFLKVELAIIAKNEFKSVTDKFTLTIYPSFSSLFKMLAAYCGTLISLIGLRLYYPRIYNILCKKRYRHPQEFLLSPGDNISATGPYPIAFISEEIRESKLLLKILKDFVASELNQNLVQHFIDSSTKELNKCRIIQTIDNIPLSKDQNKKLQHFTDPKGIKKQMIYQLIINQLITDQLKNDETSNKLFRKLKDNAFDFVEWQADGSFIINDQKLQQQQMIYTESNNESVETALLIDRESSNFNFNLLKEALWVHVFNLSNINATVSEISIQPKRQVETRSLYGCIKRFLKKDLPPVLSANGKRLGYGLKHKIDNGVVRFYGVVENEIRGKTLVLQIANRRDRILKEIWIYGEAKMSNENQALDKTNDIL